MKALILPLLVGLTVVLAPGVAHAATGFTAGDTFNSVRYEGQLTVNCSENGMSDFRIFTCQGGALDPAEYSYFSTDESADADHVTLVSTWESGKVVKKKERFDASTRQSKSAFNLWMVSLFQRPLLSLGSNKIHYQLTQGSETVKEGDFIATVRDGGIRRCDPDFLYSGSLNDCRTGVAVCDLYFQRARNCR